MLRTGSYQNIANGLALLGPTTQKDTSRACPQRRFTNIDERQYAIAAVSAAGDDPRGKESDGHFHTALHLTRPATHAIARPLHASCEIAEPVGITAHSGATIYSAVAHTFAGRSRPPRTDTVVPRP